MTGFDRLRFLMASAGFVLALMPDIALAAGNFTHPDTAVVTAAEQARRESAIFWTGNELPGRWSTPCPITVEPADHSGGGATRFHFDRGEVSGWEMRISGRRHELLHDVIPHEVDHMVRASLVRRPIPRWLDEGCAMLFESPESHRRFRERVPQYLSEPIDTAFLDRMDYPADSRSLDHQYVVGFSLVEFLLDRGGPNRLLAFQQDVRNPSQKLSDFYGLSPELLTNQWRDWAVARCRESVECHQANCRPFSMNVPETGRQNVVPSLPVLTVYTSATCGPCRRFRQDLESDPAFRQALLQRFELRIVDVDQNPLVVISRQITSVPTFETARGRLAGYEGSAWLLQQLGITPPVENSATGTAEAPESPASSPAPPAIETSPVKPQVTPTTSSEPEKETTPSPAVVAVPVLRKAVAFALTSLELAGVVSGSVATGGLGAVAVALLLRRLRRRTRDPTTANSTAPATFDAVEKARSAAGPAPFPRLLDEARELLQLRQSEGRVAALDALRGMVLDDELDRIHHTGDSSAQQFVQQLREALSNRLNEVAPVATKVDE